MAGRDAASVELQLWEDVMRFDAVDERQRVSPCHADAFRLVITPLGEAESKRSYGYEYLTLMGALQMILGGCFAGSSVLQDQLGLGKPRLPRI